MFFLGVVFLGGSMKISLFMLVFLLGFLNPQVLKSQINSDPNRYIAENADLAMLTDAFLFKFKDDISLKIYGKMEMLTYHDTTSPFVSDWYVFVNPRDTYAGQQSSTSMSVRATPIGFLFKVPNAVGSANITARLETDFCGGFTQGSMGVYSPISRLKHAYFTIGHENLEVLLGQSFVIFSPLFPSQFSWIALGASGNPWMRLPQIRLTAKYKPFQAQFSINRAMSANVVFPNQVDDIISEGEQAGVPILMARLGYSDSFDYFSLQTGVSGVYGNDKIHREDTTQGSATSGSVVDKRLPIWMAAFDLKITTKYLDFLGEVFAGENLNTFFAGILQGVSIDFLNQTARAIHTYGGWGQFTVKPVKDIFLNLGYGFDNPSTTNLSAAARSFNSTAYTNINYIVSKWFNVGIETSYMRTKYVDPNKSNSNFRMLLRTSFVY
jgi:hypothetical protein